MTFWKEQNYTETIKRLVVSRVCGEERKNECMDHRTFLSSGTSGEYLNVGYRTLFIELQSMEGTSR